MAPFALARPRVSMNFAVSIDGKIAPARKRGPFTMSRGPEDHRRMLALRERTDAVIIGAANLRVDDPDLMPSPLRVVVTRAGDQVSPTAKMFDKSLGGEAVIAHSAMMSNDTRSTLRNHATLAELGSSDVEIARLLAWLRRERGCKTVVCEGGGVLAAAFFAARAVDELHLTFVPRVLGGANAPTCVEGTGFEPDAIRDAALQSVERVGDELYVVYAFPE